MGPKRRIDVMLSSTFWDLEDKRDEVLKLMGRHDLHDIAMENDAALSTMDKIDSSLSKVGRAAAYVCIIGYRYGTREACARRNPDNLSLTELEFRCARERDIPRCTLIMSGRYRGIPLSDFEAVSAEDKTSLTDFRKLAESDRVYASFDDDADFTIKAMQSLEQLRDDLDAREQAKTAAAASSTVSFERPPSPDDNLPTIPPAFHYVRKPYIERQGFGGGAKVLGLIDRWGTSPDAMLLFQAIGGMGKSMLTWHWLKTRAAIVRDDWAGQLWYSFYEQGADLNDFCAQALAYIRHQPPRVFRGRRTLDLGDELRRELDLRPWLLILDGLERVLVAYNRAGKEHMTDEEAVVARDGMGLDREPRDCFRPEDDDVLAMLAQVGKGKLLASSRLTPTTLTNAARQPIPGVRRETLEGLTPEDAELALRNAGVHGDGWRIRRFLIDNFAGHPLSVGAVAGQVMTFLEARGDFDRWLEHPRGGADPALITKDLRGRQNHILSRAFDDLDNDEKALLGSIAMASIDLTPDILRILNPMRPIEPKKVDPPRELGNIDAENLSSLKHWELKRTLDSAKTGDVRALAQKDLDDYRKQEFERQEERYNAYVDAHPVWRQKAREADEWVEQTLPNLEARGLLQYDAVTGSLDMHPAVRHTVLLGLTPEAKGRTGGHVSDVLSSRPVKPFGEARTREDLALVITRVDALCAANKLVEAWELFCWGGLREAFRRLYYLHEQLELMQWFFPQNWEQDPLLLHEDQRADAMECAALSLGRTGKPKPARNLYVKSIKLHLENGKRPIVTLGNFAVILDELGQDSSANRVSSLALRLAEADDDKDQQLWLKANEANRHIDSGRLREAEAVLIPLREAIVKDNPRSVREAHILKCDLLFAFRSGCLSEPIAETSSKRIRALGERFDECESLEIIANWRQANGTHQAALDVWGDLIALANEIGSPWLSRHEARRAQSLAAIGREVEARRIATKVDLGPDPPHVALALLYLQLGDRAKACKHALAGHKEAWGEGPPYHHHWDLEDCRKVLSAVGEPEPSLPPFDPSKVDPFDFEADIERLIEKTIAEKTATVPQTTKRQATRKANRAKRSKTPKKP